MPNVDIPDEEMMYKVAYLTMKGWRCFRNSWYKDGQRRKVTSYYDEDTEMTDDFDLDDAFDRQEELDSTPAKV